MKKLIDANVILRYLLRDHHEHSEAARAIIEAGAFTLPEIIAEVVYVLKGVYQVERNEIGTTLQEFLYEVHMDDREVMHQALAIYSRTSLDFVDCILISRHYLLDEEVVSFDKKLNKLLK